MLPRGLFRWQSSTASAVALGIGCKGIDHDPRRRDCAKFWHNTGSTASAFTAGRLSLLSARWWVQRVRVCSCSGIVEGAALLLCQFLVQSICRPQRLPVVVDAIQRVLTAFLRRVCSWVGKLSVERFSGDCGAILTPYACARFLAPTAAKVAHACKPCAWIWFWWGRAAIKNTPPASSSAKKSAVVTPTARHPLATLPPYPLQPDHVFSVSKIFCRRVCRCDGGRSYSIGVTISPRHTDKNTDKSNTPTARRGGVEALGGVASSGYLITATK